MCETKKHFSNNYDRYLGSNSCSGPLISERKKRMLIQSQDNIADSFFSLGFLSLFLISKGREIFQSVKSNWALKKLDICDKFKQNSNKLSSQWSTESAQNVTSVYSPVIRYFKFIRLAQSSKKYHYHLLLCLATVSAR